MVNKPGGGSKRKKRVRPARNPFAKVLKESVFYRTRRREDKRRKVLERWERDHDSY